MATQNYAATVQGFYVAYYGRWADPAGLDYWTGVLAANGGDASVMINDFGDSAEFLNTYSNLVLAVMSPVFFHALLRFGARRRPLWLLVFPYLLVILYGGSRIAWMLTVVSMALYGALLLAMGLRLKTRRLVPIAAAVVVAAVLAIAQTDWLEQRVVQLGGLFSGDHELVDIAVNNRLAHWEAAVRMFEQNPVNGIGVKNYKFSYPDYASDEVFRGQPHLFLLEVAAETGSLGLLGYALFLLLVTVLLVQLTRRRRFDAVPWGLALLLAAFPLNATLSIYARKRAAACLGWLGRHSPASAVSGCCWVPRWGRWREARTRQVCPRTPASRRRWPLRSASSPR